VAQVPCVWLAYLTNSPPRRDIHDDALTLPAGDSFLLPSRDREGAEAGSPPRVLHDGVYNPSFIGTNRDRPLIKSLVVLLIWIAGGVFQQLPDAPIGKASRGLREAGVLLVSLRHQLQGVARHLQPNPAPVFVLIPAEQSTEVTSIRTFDLLAFFVGEWVRCHHGHCLPVSQHRLRS
jgi:hypothetical protein